MPVMHMCRCMGGQASKRMKRCLHATSVQVDTCVGLYMDRFNMCIDMCADVHDAHLLAILDMIADEH